MPKSIMAQMGWVILISMALALVFNAMAHLDALVSGLLLAIGGSIGAGISTFQQKRRAFRQKPNASLFPLPPVYECQDVASPGAIARVLRFVPNATTMEQKCTNSLAWRQLGTTIGSRPLLPQSTSSQLLP